MQFLKARSNIDSWIGNICHCLCTNHCATMTDHEQLVVFTNLSDSDAWAWPWHPDAMNPVMRSHTVTTPTLVFLLKSTLSHINLAVRHGHSCCPLASLHCSHLWQLSFVLFHSLHYWQLFWVCIECLCVCLLAYLWDFYEAFCIMSHCDLFLCWCCWFLTCDNSLCFISLGTLLEACLCVFLLASSHCVFVGLSVSCGIMTCFFAVVAVVLSTMVLIKPVACHLIEVKGADRYTVTSVFNQLN